jgi:hypothetical protein
VGFDIRRIDELLKIAGWVLPECSFCIYLFSRDKVNVQRWIGYEEMKGVRAMGSEREAIVQQPTGSSISRSL